jgi:hypothetical protein
MRNIQKHCELVSWIPEKRPGASTMTFFYPLTMGHWPDGMSLGDMDAPLSRLGGDDINFINLNLDTWCGKYTWGIRELCGKHMETLKKIQKWLPRIMVQVAACSDNIRGCRLKKKFFKPYQKYTDQNRATVQTCLHGDAHAWNMFWNTNLITKSHEEIEA